MFIRYYLELDLPVNEVGKALFADPSSWIPGLAREADDRAQRLLAEVGFDVGQERRIDKEVEIHVGTPHVLNSKTRLPIRWTAHGGERLFPALDADIEIAPLGSGRTQLAISARYRPPLGMVGEALDKTLLHRIAEATIKDFLDRAGERITSGIRSAPVTGSSLDRG
jgi:hypothetical protein